MVRMPFNSLNNAALLISLGFGYIIYYLANKENKALKRIGCLIGAFIIVLSIIFIIINLILALKCYSQAEIMVPHWHK